MAAQRELARIDPNDGLTQRAVARTVFGKSIDAYVRIIAMETG